MHGASRRLAHPWPTCATLLVASLGVASPASSQARHVVVVYDERRDLPGLSMFDAGLVEALASSTEAVELYREEMDLSRLGADEGRLSRLRDLWREKYRDVPVDVVVPVMGPAFNFVLTHRDSLIPDAAVVFSGVSWRELEGRSLPTDATGVILQREFAPTVELALRLQPTLRRVVLVSGTSDFDRVLAAQALQELRAYEERLAITHLDDLPLSAILEEVSRLPAESAVFYSTVFQDGAGNAYVPHDVAREIATAASVPTYAFLDQYLGSGILGGHMYSLARYGQEAGRLVLSVLDGAAPSSLPVVGPAVSETLLDWRQVQRWRLDPSRIPPDAITRFRELTFWEEYRGWMVGALALVTLQSLLIAALVMQRLRQRRAEARLIESEDRFTRLADEAPVMMWKVDTERRLTFANRSWLEFVGGTLEEHEGLGWARLVHAEDLERVLEVSGLAMERREGFSFDLRVRRHDGEYRWLLCNGVPRFSDSGALLGYIGSNIDVTESREAEVEKQRATTQLAHAARVAMIGELAASVAHELNQPLGAILANAEAAEMVLDESEPALEELRAILADIRADNQRASGILDPIRHLLRKHQSEPVRVDVNALVEAILKLARIEVAARRVSLAFEPHDALPPVRGDRAQLQQVVMNLVLNGLDAMTHSPDAQRRLVVRTSNGDPGMVKISVADAGVGVRDDLLDTIFEPFYTTKEQGLGLGLSLSRTIVKAHRGRIWAENNADVGVTFHVALPDCQEPT